MSLEIKVPPLPESVADAVVSKFYKKEGDYVERNENLVDLETDKVMLEVPAPKSGTIEKIVVASGTTVKAGQILVILSEGEKGKEAAPKTAEKKEEPKAETKTEQPKSEPKKETPVSSGGPAARRRSAADEEVNTPKQEVRPAAKPAPASSEPGPVGGNRSEKRVPMSRLRARIAERLVEAQSEAAILTTFNEINMKPIMDMRKHYQDRFEKTHGVRLGFMSFFTKAVIEALKRFPAVNSSIEGQDIIYHNYYDIGIAVSSPRGLVVPVLRNAENMSMADVEKAIRTFAEKAKDAKLTIEEMTGGTFTITNGGVFGSMLSTPIINPPQSGILGMHNIVERPVVENGQIVIRPIMYVALSYDHRVIDGRESVSFLVTIKELLEDPARLILEV